MSDSTPRFAAGLDGVILHSHGCRLLGGFYRAQGGAPRPTVVLLHGIPGVEKNLDLASALREAGCNVLYFHYRGCWGSEGTYTLAGQLADVRVATDWVLQQACVDARRLALVGNSLGGYMALAAAAADERARAVVALCPLSDPARNRLPASFFAEFATMLPTTSAGQLEAEWHALPAVTSMASALGGRQLLFVTGDQDTLFPPEHYQPLRTALPGPTWIRYSEGDHSLSLCRSLMLRAVVNWLRHGTGWGYLE